MAGFFVLAVVGAYFFGILGLESFQRDHGPQMADFSDRFIHVGVLVCLAMIASGVGGFVVFQALGFAGR